jgi:RND superfamily putative drug exporter
MDYEVFLLSRVKEHVDSGHDTATAVRRGCSTPARIILSAVLLMLVVFGCFGAARMGDIEEVGTDCSSRCWSTPPSSGAFWCPLR